MKPILRIISLLWCWLAIVVPTSASAEFCSEDELKVVSETFKKQRLGFGNTYFTTWAALSRWPLDRVAKVYIAGLGADRSDKSLGGLAALFDETLREVDIEWRFEPDPALANVFVVFAQTSDPQFDAASHVAMDAVLDRDDKAELLAELEQNRIDKRGKGIRVREPSSFDFKCKIDDGACFEKAANSAARKRLVFVHIFSRDQLAKGFFLAVSMSLIAAPVEMFKPFHCKNYEGVFRDSERTELSEHDIGVLRRSVPSED